MAHFRTSYTILTADCFNKRFEFTLQIEEMATEHLNKSSNVRRLDCQFHTVWRNSWWLKWDSVLFCAHHWSSSCRDTLSFSEFRGDTDQRLTGGKYSLLTEPNYSRLIRKRFKTRHINYRVVPRDVYGLTRFLYHCFKQFGTQANAASGIAGDMMEPNDTHRV
jgi:hypothetical protein